jgi:hypothetical protein
MNHREMMRRRVGGTAPSADFARRPVVAMPRSIELEIEQLDLTGVTPADGYRIGDAVQRELTRLLGEQGLPSIVNSAELERVKGATISLDRSAGAAVIGNQIAEAVHGSLANIGSGNHGIDAANAMPVGKISKR